MAAYVQRNYLLCMERNIRTRVKQFYHQVLGNICVYCGEPAECGDHLFPVAAMQGRCKDNLPPSVLLVVVPACTECNGIAHARVFNSLEEKRSYIQWRLRRKYNELSSWKDWSKEEFAELCPNLQSTILAKRKKKEKLRRRMSWSAKNVDAGLSPNDSGNVFVPSSAKPPFMQKKLPRPDDSTQSIKPAAKSRPRSYKITTCSNYTKNGFTLVLEEHIIR